MAQVCDPELFSDIDPENRTNCEICQRDLQGMMQSMDSVITSCRHIIETAKCSKMFKQVMTEGGICFTYNGLDVYREQVKKDMTKPTSESWTLDDGYKNVTQHWNVFPSAGSKLALVIGLEVDNYMNDGLCKGPIQGYKVYLHLPNEIPQISKHYYLVPYRQLVQIWSSQLQRCETFQSANVSATSAMRGTCDSSNTTHKTIAKSSVRPT
jgi:hypothetical protein